MSDVPTMPPPADPPVYLDNAATTRPDPRVVEAMLPALGGTFGNPGSRNHAFGWAAEELVAEARARVAELLNAGPKEIVFTSGATEANNLAIKGAAEMYARAPAGSSGRGHIITSATEHKAVLDPCHRLGKRGFDITFLTPGPDGVITRPMVAEALRPDTLLVSLMWANNETGVINEIPAIGGLCRERGVLLHTDATQWVGLMPTDVQSDNVDMLSLSGHKLHAPKGIGALYVRRRRPRVRLVAQLDGGGQERGLRSGTINVPGAVGLGAACGIAREEMDGTRERLLALRRVLEGELTANLPHTRVNGHPGKRTPHISNISFGFIEGEGLMMAIKDIAVSSGSACTSASLEPSYVLRAMGIGDDMAHSSIRFSFSRFTEEREVRHAVERVSWAVAHLRSLSPLWDLHNEGIDIGSIQWAHH